MENIISPSRVVVAKNCSLSITEHFYHRLRVSSMSRKFADLAGTVASEVLLNAKETSRLLTALGIPHTLIGGLAVGFHGHPRATKDVDYLVGVEAFASTDPLLVFREELKNIARVGVVDLMEVPTNFPALMDHLSIPADGDIPVVPVEALILLKLLAGRPQDVADVSALLEAGADLKRVTRYLRENAPSLVERFAEIVR